METFGISAFAADAHRLRPPLSTAGPTFRSVIAPGRRGLEFRLSGLGRVRPVIPASAETAGVRTAGLLFSAIFGTEHAAEHFTKAMKFFFDTHDGGTLDPDTAGIDLPDEDAARNEARRALTDMAREKLPNGSHMDFGVVVRDEAGSPIYTANLSFVARGRH